MIRFAPALILALLIGCAPVGGHREQTPAPKPPDALDGTAAAARDLIAGIGEAYAQEAARTADKADSYTSWEAAIDDWNVRNHEAKSSKLAAFVAALNAATGKDDVYDKAKLKQAATDAARGFKAIGK